MRHLEEWECELSGDALSAASQRAHESLLRSGYVPHGEIYRKPGRTIEGFVPGPDDSWFDGKVRPSFARITNVATVIDMFGRPIPDDKRTCQTQHWFESAA